MTESDDVELDWHNLLFDVRRSVRYHDRRVRFFDRVRKAISSLTLLSGSGAIITAISSAGQAYFITMAAIIAALSVIDLIADPAGFARLHNDLKRRFISLERKMVEADKSKSNVKAFTAARLAIEADEPPVLRVLDLLCHNEMCRAMGYDEKHCKKITPVQQILAPFMDFHTYHNS